MSMCALIEIFQAKVNMLLGDIKGVKIYIDDIIVLRKDRFEKNIDQLIIIFGRLRTAGIKVNAPMCSFGLKEITYLGYVITGEGIKHNPKKVQGITDIGRPSTTTEAQLLIGMDQYYMDMCP